MKEKERKTEGDQAQYSLRKQQSVNICSLLQFSQTVCYNIQYTIWSWCRSMIESLQAENADLKKNLSLAGSRQNELKV